MGIVISKFPRGPQSDNFKKILYIKEFSTSFIMMIT